MIYLIYKFLDGLVDSYRKSGWLGVILSLAISAVFLLVVMVVLMLVWGP